jgi:hypothetical protein
MALRLRPHRFSVFPLQVVLRFNTQVKTAIMLSRNEDSSIKLLMRFQCQQDIVDHLTSAQCIRVTKPDYLRVESVSLLHNEPFSRTIPFQLGRSSFLLLTKMPQIPRLLGFFSVLVPLFRLLSRPPPFPLSFAHLLSIVSCFSLDRCPLKTAFRGLKHQLHDNRCRRRVIC